MQCAPGAKAAEAMWSENNYASYEDSKDIWFIKGGVRAKMVKIINFLLKKKFPGMGALYVPNI